jgi:hypothetical protein
MRIKVYLFSKYSKARAQSFSVFVLSIFTNGSKGFEYIRRNLKNKHDLKRAGVKKVSALVTLVHVYALVAGIVTRPCGSLTLVKLQSGKLNFLL